MNDLLSVKQLAKTLNLSERTIHRKIREGMPNIRIGRVYRFEYEAVIEWLRGGDLNG